jgi:hypothetical protein
LLVVYFGGDCFVLEFKLNYDSYSEPEGLKQLARYLDKLGEKRMEAPTRSNRFTMNV